MPNAQSWLHCCLLQAWRLRSLTVDRWRGSTEYAMWREDPPAIRRKRPIPLLSYCCRTQALYCWLSAGILWLNTVFFFFCDQAFLFCFYDNEYIQNTGLPWYGNLYIYRQYSQDIGMCRMIQHKGQTKKAKQNKQHKKHKIKCVWAVHRTGQKDKVGRKWKTTWWKCSMQCWIYAFCCTL